MTPYEIPLIPRNHTTTTTINGVDYRLTVIWNAIMDAWIMDIADSAGNPLIAGITLVSGTDLLGQYQYVGIGAGMLMSEDPTYSSLGTDAKLYFVA